MSFILSLFPQVFIAPPNTVTWDVSLALPKLLVNKYIQIVNAVFIELDNKLS